jgi:hypothetical protein
MKFGVFLQMLGVFIDFLSLSTQGRGLKETDHRPDEGRSGALFCGKRSLSSQIEDSTKEKFSDSRFGSPGLKLKIRGSLNVGKRFFD